MHWSVLPSIKFDAPIEIRYTNARGEAKSFTGDRRSLRVRGRHLSVCVAPSGLRIALALERISNLDDLTGAIPIPGAQEGGPTPHEAYVMQFHRRQGATSALFNSLAAKYPDF